MKFFHNTSPAVARNSARFGVLLALLLIAAPYTPADSEHSNNALVGTWVTEATLSVVPPGFPADGKFEAIDTFSSDGTMTAVSQIPGVTIGSGVWKKTSSTRFTFTFTFYRTDPSSPLKMLPVLVNENVRMIDNDHYQTTDVILPLDANGQPLNLPPCGGVCAFPGTVTATRYPFQNYNTTLP